MGSITKIFGAAGTGKTTWVYNNVLQPASDSEIADTLALSFTRAAKTALLNKEKRLSKKQVRTLHSICFQKLGLSSDNLLTVKKIQSFMEENGYDYSPDDMLSDDVLFERTGNSLLRWYSRLLNELPYYIEDNQINIAKFYTDYMQIIPFSLQSFYEFYTLYTRYMKLMDAYDYTTILAFAYMEGIKLEGVNLILDESQDLSPLMISILEPNFKNFERIYILGDDDQTIYHSLNGADAKFLLEIENAKEIVLPKSWRLPIPVWKIARSYIEKNKYRKHKDYTHSGREGKVELTMDIISPVIDSYENRIETYVLFRHRHHAKKFISTLNKYNIPHWIIGKDEQKYSDLISALNTYYILKGKKSGVISSVMFMNFFENLKDEIKKQVFRTDSFANIKIDFTFSKTREQIFGYYPELKELINYFPVTIFGKYNRLEINTWDMRVKDDTKLKDWLQPFIHIGTIHQSKGLEADRVILPLLMTKKAYNNMTEEFERKVWYVGMTRAKKELIFYTKQRANLINKEILAML